MSLEHSKEKNKFDDKSNKNDQIVKSQAKNTIATKLKQFFQQQIDIKMNKIIEE